jgi:carbohydrate kinase (thermoresistant glucokinase family)
MREPGATAEPILVVMGVSGCGKSTVGAALAGRLGWTYTEGDDFHPQANVDKMRAGKPLDDADRQPWLAAIARWMDGQANSQRPGVIGCSALKRRYRDFLRANHPQVWFLYLRVPREILQRRLEKRHHEYMPASLLDSQLATLEEPDQDEPRTIIVEAGGALDATVAALMHHLHAARVPIEEQSMASPACDTVATIIPTLRYRDALAAIEWLCRAFGFEKHAVYAEGETVHHAQLSFGNGMVMLGSADNWSAWGKRIVQPDEIGGRETQACYVVVADCAVHYAQAKAAGAQIVDELEAKDYGGSGYSCRDPEGHLWSFGDYDPWAEHAA